MLPLLTTSTVGHTHTCPKKKKQEDRSNSFPLAEVKAALNLPMYDTGKEVKFSLKKIIAQQYFVLGWRTNLSIFTRENYDFFL